MTIAGSGAMAGQLEKRLHGLAPGWSVEIVPPIDRLTARLCEFDGVLMPSRFEGLGLLAVEVLMAGVPLVTTDAPGLSEAVPADYPMKAGVDDVEALGRLVARVIDDPGSARAGVAGLRDGLSHQFSPAAMAKAYAARYAALAAPG